VHVEGSSHGEGIKLNKAALSTLKRFPIPLPPLPEQRKIATILSTWDLAIGKLEETIAQLQLRKKGLMQRLLTGRQRLPGFEGEWKEVRLGEVKRVTRITFQELRLMTT
jgi:type I restriction enzyme S subunit